MYPQRLPIVDDDDGVWGDILRNYLLKEHYDTGSDNAANGGHKNVTIRAGTAGAGGAPLKFTSGTLLTTPEVGAMEFAGDNLYLTQTSGTTRKKVALYNTSGATGDLYYRSGSDDFTQLPIGSSNQILTVSGGVPTWQTPSVTSTFNDSAFTLTDNGDATKIAKFELSGITTATTRTYTLPNVSGNVYVSSGTDVSVADGGTGRSTSTTAYGLIAAGTTATGAHQTISPGTSGQFLKSAGASSLASFASITAADITGTTAQFNTALSDGDFATIAGSEVLTNKTLTTPRIGTSLLDTNGNTLLGVSAVASAVNYLTIGNAATGNAPSLNALGSDSNIHMYLNPKGTGGVKVYAATGQTPNIGADGADANHNLNLTSKGTGRVQANGVNIPTISSSDVLTNKTISGSSNTLTNIPYSAVTGLPSVIAAGSSIPAALTNVHLAPLSGGWTDATYGWVNGAYSNNAIYSHPESDYFAPIPHAYNDIAYNNIRGGSVQVLLNGSTYLADGNNAAPVFTPDATFHLANYYASTSDTLVFVVTLHRTFYYGNKVGIQQTDWCRGQNVQIEGYVNGAWTTFITRTSEPTGLTWSNGDATANGMTKIRITLTNFNVAAASGIRITQIFIMAYNSSLLSSTFLPLGGGQLFGDLQVPAVRTSLLRDTNNNGILELYGNASAVNYLHIQNAASGGAPGIHAQGANTNINLNLTPKGTGTVDVASKRITSVANPTGAQDAATKNYVDSAVSGSTGYPYDLSIIAFGTYTARVANSYGDFPMGIKLQRAVTFTQVIYRVNTADASGNLVVQLRKNGSTVSGTSATIAAANQIAGGTVTGSWTFVAGDILTVYITGVGTSPGAGLIADIRGTTT